MNTTNENKSEHEKMALGGLNSKHELFWMVVSLSLPSMWAQVSSVVMQYIDSAMVGHLGADAAAAIGVTASVTWLFGGLCSALTTGFTVQAAQASGAGEADKAKRIMHHGFWTATVIGIAMATVGLWLSSRLPVWMNADPSIHKEATDYFRIYALSLPFIQLNGYAVGMLQSSGNMRVSGVLTMAMYGMDILFNFILIFPARYVDVLGIRLFVAGMGLGVEGAALGTALSQVVTALLMLYMLLVREPDMRLRKGELFHFGGSSVHSKEILLEALRLGAPIGAEQIVMRGAQITTASMIASLGTVAMATHSLAITAESFAYMPAYGIGLTQVAITGREIGSGDRERAKQVGWAGIRFAAIITIILSTILFIFAPQLMRMLTPDTELIELGTTILRIEAFAELLYGTQLVCTGILQGRGDTLVSSAMVLACLWFVRVPLTMILIRPFGLTGAWLAMSIELCVRGLVFLGRFQFSKR